MLLSALLVGGAACGKKDNKDKAPDPKPAETQPAAPAPAEPPPAAAAAPAAPATGLAAITLPNQRTGKIDQVVSGGQPTEDNLKQAKDQGVKVVVNLRTEGEKAEFDFEEKAATDLGMKYVNIPINGKTGDGLTEENAKKLGEILAAADKPVLLHCASGQRVGALLTLKAFYVDKATPEAALQVGHDNGLSSPALEKIVTDQINAKKG
jgi:uncharacterized protein (TIGR01244 family)